VAGMRAVPVPRSPVVAHAEAAPAPTPSSSVALVNVNEENKLTTASLIGGVAGLLVGGLWVGVGLFAAASYLSRNDTSSDVSKVLTGISGAGLEAVNFAAGVESKYEVTGKVGDVFSDALESAKKKPKQKVVARSMSTFANAVGGYLHSVDKDMGVKDALGDFLTAASEIAYSTVASVVEFSHKYNVTDRIKERIDGFMSNFVFQPQYSSSGAPVVTQDYDPAAARTCA